VAGTRSCRPVMGGEGSCRFPAVPRSFGPLGPARTRVGGTSRTPSAPRCGLCAACYLVSGRLSLTFAAVTAVSCSPGVVKGRVRGVAYVERELCNAGNRGMRNEPHTHTVPDSCCFSGLRCEELSCAVWVYESSLLDFSLAHTTQRNTYSTRLVHDTPTKCEKNNTAATAALSQRCDAPAFRDNIRRTSHERRAAGARSSVLLSLVSCSAASAARHWRSMVLRWSGSRSTLVCVKLPGIMRDVYSTPSR
jgi:hypothetical protein